MTEMAKSLLTETAEKPKAQLLAGVLSTLDHVLQRVGS